jgi:hypothetical protein
MESGLQNSRLKRQKKRINLERVHVHRHNRRLILAKILIISYFINGY